MGNKNSLVLFVVDDDFLSRELCKQHLLNMGFSNIHVFENGEECINKLHLNPDIIFLDYEMSPFNGLEVLQRIKHLYPHTYCMLISGQNDMQVVINAFKYGAIDYVVKNDQFPEALSATVNNLLHSNAFC